MACQFGNLSIVQYLIEKGANIKVKDENKQTPLYYASKECNTDIVKYINGIAKQKGDCFIGWYSENSSSKEYISRRTISSSTQL